MLTYRHDKNGPKKDPFRTKITSNLHDYAEGSLTCNE